MVSTYAKKTIAPILLALLVSSCAGKGLSDYLPSVAGAGAAAVCSNAGPAAAAACAGAAGIGVEVTIPAKQRQLSDDPEIAKQQLKTEEREHFVDMLFKYGAFLFVFLWFFRSPQDMIRNWMRKENAKQTTIQR